MSCAPLLTSFAANVSLTTDDLLGFSSFNAVGNWNNAAAPSAAHAYFNANFLLRTPPDINNYTFAGSALTITSASAIGADLNDALIFKGILSGNTTITISNFTVNGGNLRNGSSDANSFTLAGNVLTVGTSGMGVHLQGPLIIRAPVAGSGPIKIVDGGSSSTARTLTFSNANNTFTGSIEVVNALNSRFALAAGANLNFVIGSSGVNNSVFGAGTATFNGRFVFNLASAATTVGSSWNITPVTTKSFGTTFSVDGFTRQGFGTGPGIWNLTTNGATYEFNTTSGTLAVVTTPTTNNAPSLSAPSVKFQAVEADLLAAYAASYASSVGGQDNAEVIIANTVAGNNAINDQSGTGARMRLVGCYQSNNDVTGQTTTGGIVGWLANNDARLADVVTLGSTLGADLVTYICNNTDSGSIAAVAQQPGMYSAHNPGAVWSAVFAHEAGGHNFGRSHSDGLLSPKSVMLHNYCSGGAAPPYFFTNPKIWFNGTQFVGDGNNCSQGSLINGGDNSLPSAESAVGVADRRTRVLAGPNLTNVVRRWVFTNAPAAITAGTTNLDVVAGVPAIVRGNGAIYTGNALRLPGGTSGNVAADAMAAYIDLPNGLISAHTNLTLELWATPLSAPNWARLLDFGRTTEAGNGAAGEWTGAPGTPAPGTTSSSDGIALTLAIGTDLTAQRFEAKLDGTATTLDSALATIAGVPHHYAITFTEGAGAFGGTGGRWQWFRDGDPIAYLDVNHHLADLEDVNNWLGRSLWSNDQLANCDYTEVRISNVALSRDEVLANYLLGPNHQPTTTVTLTGSDALGSSSFNAAGLWDNAATPTAADSYETHAFWLRTPANALNHTFAGNTLKLSGGTLLYKSSGSSTITVTNLQLNGGIVAHSGSGTFTLAGNLAISTNGAQFNAQNGTMNITAPIAGLAPVSFIGQNSVTLTGNNTNFLGKSLIGNGWFGSVTIDSPARLGPAPAGFSSNHLAFNRGTLVTTATMTLSNDNRGILFDVSGGTFNVASGTTLTVASALASPATAANVFVGGLTKNGGGTLVLSSTNSTFKGGVWLDSGSSSAADGSVRLVNSTALANSRSPWFIRNNNSGTSTLQLDGSAGGFSISQGISLAGRNLTTAAIQNVAGTNTISGNITLQIGGANYRLQSDSGGLLTLGGTLSSDATGSRTVTFLGSGQHRVTGVIADGSATLSLVKSGTGSLELNGANTFTGTATIAGGTMWVNGSLNAASVAVGDISTLGGNGVINGLANLNSGSTLAPGLTTGRLTINNTTTLAGGSVTRMELNKSSQTNDILVVNGNLQYGGNLSVTNLSGTLAAGDAFRLFQATSTSGSFAATNLPVLTAGLAWNFDAASGVLRVVATDPASLGYQLSSGTNLTLSWPTTHLGWRLLTQTNPLSAGLGTNWFTVPGSTATNQLTFPVSADQPSVFYRLAAP
jgi:autotransporter-associated beta strand protein